MMTALPNGGSVEAPTGSARRDELHDLLSAVQPLLDDFISQGDASVYSDTPLGSSSTTLVSPASARTLAQEFGGDDMFPTKGRGVAGLKSAVDGVLAHSVNTWHQGFLSKLYAAPNAVGVVAEMVLAVLNTNVHVRDVAPALSAVEEVVGKRLAGMFGLKGDRAGGLSQQGGSSANLTALVVARNTMFPQTKSDGAREEKLVLFTSEHGHYSFEKAAQVCGLGSRAVWAVDVDADGRMSMTDLERKVAQAREQGYTPFFVNATAGTTVLGSFDPMVEIGRFCHREKLWFHVDASWGGAVVFSTALRHKMQGAELAQTITYNPHKMLNVPVTCSFLLVADMMQAWRSNTLPANYLFHGGEGREEELPEDIADMTLQCGRKGDALKLALSWVYYGSQGFEARINHAFDMAATGARLVGESKHLVLVSTDPPPCLQVCFYFARGGQLGESSENSRVTRALAGQLREQGFSVDFAPGENGLFLRAVVSLETRASTLVRLVDTVERIGLSLQAEGPR